MEHLLLVVSIRAALIGVGTGLVLRLMRVKAAALLHAVWSGVLMWMLLLPAWTAWGPKAAVQVLPALQAAAMEPPAPVAPTTLVAMTTLNDAPQSPTPPVPVRTWPPWGEVLPGIYTLGVLWMLFRLAIGTYRANRLTGASCVAPLTVGLLRPRVVLPENWRDWTQEQLEAILAHENAHVRRRDPLIQWLALLNRAVFWFHPLAWWLERRLAALAEEACDSAVLEGGHDAGKYAECLLAIEREVRQAGARVAALGMAMPGSALPQRIKKIFEARPARVSRTRKLCAITACGVAGALFGAGTLDHIPANLPLRPLPIFPLPQPPVLVAQARTQPGPAVTPPPVVAAPEPAFEVASVRPAPPGGRGRGGNGPSGLKIDPGLYEATNHSLIELFRFAYNLRRYQQLTAPDWMSAAWYDISAKTANQSTLDEKRLMLRKLLADRFQLKFHIENKPMEVMALIVARGGAKLHAADPAAAASDRSQSPSESFGRWSLFANTSMENLANLLSGVCGTLELPWGPVVDMTGIQGQYDARVETVPNPGTGPRSIIDQYCEAAPKLGLEFKLEKIRMDIYVIDSAEKTPTEN